MISRIFLGDALSQIEKLTQRLTDKRGLSQALAVTFLRLTKKGFNTSSGPDGKPWKKLVLRRGRPLHLTGKLRNSVQVQVFNGGNQINLSSNLVQSRLMQFGGTVRAKNGGYLMFRTPTGFAKRKSVTIPARPYLPGTVPFSRSWINAIDATHQEFIGKGL